MTNITERLEGILPPDGPQTKDEQLIAEAVEELRGLQAAYDHLTLSVDMLINDNLAALNRMGDRKPGKLFALGAALGIAVGLLAGWVV